MTDTPPTPPQDTPDDTVIRHGFSVGAVHLLVPPGIRVELREAPAFSPLPLSPPWFKGMANHRGDVIPVFSVPELLLPQHIPANSAGWLLVLDSPPKMCGLLIDSYPHLLTALQDTDLDGIAGLPERIKPFVYAAYTGHGKTWLDFRHDAWLLSVKALFQDYSLSH